MWIVVNELDRKWKQTHRKLDTYIMVVVQTGMIMFMNSPILAIFWLSEPHQIKYICNDIHVRCPNTRYTFPFIWYQILSYIKWCCFFKLIQCKCIYFTCLNDSQFIPCITVSRVVVGYLLRHKVKLTHTSSY